MLYNAYNSIGKPKQLRDNRVKFRYYLEDNLFDVLERLNNETFVPVKLKTEIIYEPKRREIQIPAIIDKIVQHAICDNYLTECIEKYMIKESSSCIVGRGTEYARNLLVEQMVKYRNKYNTTNFFVLKCDIKSFFASIDIDITKNLVNRYVDDDVIARIVNQYLSLNERGLPLGLQQSQLLANLYLTGLDHFCKEQLGAKYYGRHMDDFYIISDDKVYLENCLRRINDYVGNLKLKLNPKTKIMQNRFDYLGFTYFFTDTGKVVKRKQKDKKHQKYRHLKKQLTLLESEKISAEEFALSYQGCRASMIKADTHSLLRKWDDIVRSTVTRLGYDINITRKRVIIECQHKELSEN